jgi:ABC-type Fe3+ transport system substrate-binding protein
MRIGLALAAIIAIMACQPTRPAAAPAAPAAPAQPSAATAPAAEQSEVRRLLDAARADGETELNVSWGQALFGSNGTEGARQFEALFNRMYGTNIRINFTPGPSFLDMAAKLTQEAMAGRKASTDLYVGTEAEYAPWLNPDVLERYEYTKLNPTRMPREVVATHNLGVEVYTTIPGVVYNATLISAAEAPRKLTDTLDPKWRGKIASPPTATYFDAIALHPDWGIDRMKDYIAALSRNLGGLIRATETTRVASGEFQMMVLSSSHATARLQADGAPLAFSLPEDAAVVRFIYLSVPRNAVNPNLAKLFINAAMSEEGQQLTYEKTFSDHYALPGSRAGADLQALKARGIKIAEIDVDVVAQHPELKGAIEDMVRLLRG